MTLLRTAEIIVYLVILARMICILAPKLAEREARRKQTASENKESTLVRMRRAVVYIGLSLMFIGGAALTSHGVIDRLTPGLAPESGRVIGLFMAGTATYITVDIRMEFVDDVKMYDILLFLVIAAIGFACWRDMLSHSGENLEIELALAGGILLDYIQKLVKWIYPRQEH